jgi:hypothetical protein
MDIMDEGVEALPCVEQPVIPMHTPDLYSIVQGVHGVKQQRILKLSFQNCSFEAMSQLYWVFIFPVIKWA